MRRHHDVISEAPRELGEGVISDSANIGRYRWLGIHKGARPPRRSAMGRRTKGDNFDCWEWMGKEILIYRRRVYPDSCVIPPYKVLRSLPSSRGAVHFLLGNSCRFSKYAHRYSHRKSDAVCDESAEVAIFAWLRFDRPFFHVFGVRVSFDIFGEPGYFARRLLPSFGRADMQTLVAARRKSSAHSGTPAATSQMAPSASSLSPPLAPQSRYPHFPSTSGVSICTVLVGNSRVATSRLQRRLSEIEVAPHGPVGRFDAHVRTHTHESLRSHAELISSIMRRRGPAFPYRVESPALSVAIQAGWVRGCCVSV